MPQEKPKYLANAVLQGVLSHSEGRYSLTIGETTIPAPTRSKDLHKWLQDQGQQYLNNQQLWRCYPRTNADGSLKCVQLIALAASDEAQLVNIQGRASEDNGKIKVSIHRNDDKAREKSKSFYLSLVGSLSIQTGEFWQVSAILNNGFLLAIGGQKLADAPKPIRKGKKLILKKRKVLAKAG